MSVDHFPFTPEHSPLRRPILQGTLAVGALTLAPGHVLAQAGVPLYKLPRYALVIGNSSYANAPLVNPVNDARAIAGELKAAGFEVSVQLDASREGMLKAIEAFSRMLAARNAVANSVKLSDGTLYTDAQHHIAEYSLGKRWTARHRLVNTKGSTYDSEIDYQVVAKERITVPAGTFEAFRIEGLGWSQSDKYGVNVYNLFWISPEVRRYIAHETRQRFANGKPVKHERYDLTGYAQR